jgi:hypothetical protein
VSHWSLAQYTLTMYSSMSFSILTKLCTVTINFINVSLLQEKPPTDSQLSLIPCYPPVLCNHQTILCRFAFSEHFFQLESYNVCSFLNGFKIHPCRSNVLLLCSFLWPNNIPLSDCTTFHLCIHQLVDICDFFLKLGLTI